MANAIINATDRLCQGTNAFAQAPWVAVRDAFGIPPADWNARNLSQIRARLISESSAEQVTLASAQQMTDAFTTGLADTTAQSCVNSMNGPTGIAAGLTAANATRSRLSGAAAGTLLRDTCTDAAADALTTLTTAQALEATVWSGVVGTNANASIAQSQGQLNGGQAALVQASERLSGAPPSAGTVVPRCVELNVLAAVLLTDADSVLLLCTGAGTGGDVATDLGFIEAGLNTVHADIEDTADIISGAVVGAPVTAAAATALAEATTQRNALDLVASKANPGFAPGGTILDARTDLNTQISAAVDTAVTGMRAEAVARAMPGAATATLSALWTFLQTQLVP